jgi:DNA polymerase I-like protein with 3'-5' exonuclease and polymerase domains
MIQAKLAKNPKCLLIFDVPPAASWMTHNMASMDGIGAFLARLQDAGINIQTDVSTVCLTDVKNPKAADFKAKAEYIKDLIETQGYNVLMPIGAAAFEKVMNHKGIERYFGQSLWSEIYNTKVVPCPNPAMVRYKPEIVDVLNEVIQFAKVQMEFPEREETTKLPTSYHVIDTIGKFRKFLAVYMTVDKFAFDLETSGFRFNADQILTIQFSHKPGYAYLIPTDFYQGQVCGTTLHTTYWMPSEWQEIEDGIRQIFARVNRDNVLVIGQNVKFDLKFVLHHWQCEMPRPENLADTMCMSFVVDENSPNDLKYMACTMTDLGDYEFELENWKKDYCKVHKLKVSEFSYALIPFDILCRYALVDPDATIRVYEHLLPLVAIEEQEDVLVMLMRFTYAALRMEMTGWPVDLEYADQYHGELTQKIEALGQELLGEPLIVKAARILGVKKLLKDNEKRKNKLTELKEPFVFNVGSTDQKRVLFFDVMGLPVEKYTKAKDAEGKRTTPAIDKEVMDAWISKYPKHETLLVKIRTYNELVKMRSTYVEAILEKAIVGPDGVARIHPRYNVCGARTGRLSSSDPNWQNVPAHSDEAKNVKKVVAVSDSSKELLGADLGAAEMRYAQIVSGDQKLEAIFAGSGKVHEEICKEVFNLTCSLGEVKSKYPELRQISKTIQFLSIYGGGPDALASKIKIGKNRATEILAALEGKSEAAAELADMFAMPIETAHKVLASVDKIGALRKAFERTSEQAQQLLDDYFRKYSGVNRFITDTTSFTKEHGYSLSMLGRKRRVPGVKSDDNASVQRAVRQAVNATVQSIASDGLMLSVCDLIDHIEREGITWAKVLGVIHDSAYLEVDKSRLLEARDLLLHFLRQYPAAIRDQVTIPMVADAEHGRNWAEFDEKFDADGFSELYQEDEEEEAV